MAAAFTAPAGLSIITTSFKEGPARNKALLVYTATGATGWSAASLRGHGGIVGQLSYVVAHRLVQDVGVGILVVFLFLIGVSLLTGTSLGGAYCDEIRMLLMLLMVISSFRGCA